jgi:acetyl esterase/lipase
MAHDIQNDRRIDPRIKALLQYVPAVTASRATTREELIAEANTPEALQGAEDFRQLMAVCDTEEAAPSEGLNVSMDSFEVSPDGHRINLQIIRPDGDEIVACVYYIHGGGMTNLSCFDGMYRGWGKLVAANGVAVVMVDFRNAISPSSVPEVAPYPAGLDDCIAGFHWTVGHTTELGIDPARIVIAGESGGGNLTLASGMRLLRDGDIDQVKGLYALCPYLAGAWPQEHLPSTYENNGILLDLHGGQGALAYGIEAFEARDPLAWPLFATVDDVAGLPPVVINVNESDPLRDEGIEFYRLLLEAGVAARCRQQMGTMHGTEIFTVACPDVSRDTARDLAAFARD